MSDVNKVRSNAGVQYGFEDTEARQLLNRISQTTDELAEEIDDLLETESGDF